MQGMHNKCECIGIHVYMWQSQVENIGGVIDIQTTKDCQYNNSRGSEIYCVSFIKGHKKFGVISHS